MKVEPEYNTAYCATGNPHGDIPEVWVKNPHNKGFTMSSARLVPGCLLLTIQLFQVWTRRVGAVSMRQGVGDFGQAH